VRECNFEKELSIWKERREEGRWCCWYRGACGFLDWGTNAPTAILSFPQNTTQITLHTHGCGRGWLNSIYLQIYLYKIFEDWTQKTGVMADNL